MPDSISPENNRSDRAFVEAGRRGGETVKERYGTPFFQTIGRLGAERGAEKGGEARKRELGRDGYAALGRMGGKAVYEKLGRDHMREIGRRGGKARVAQSRAVENTEPKPETERRTLQPAAPVRSEERAPDKTPEAETL